MKKILVTGAGGFIGYNLCNQLAEMDYSILGVDLHYPDNNLRKDHSNFSARVGDFRNSDQMESWLSGVDAVIHLASAHLQISMDKTEYWDINVNSLRPFIQLADQKKVKKFLHISSVGVYGKLLTIPADEKTPCEPQSIYGETKFAGEKEVIKYYKETGFPVIILRPAWVYGPFCPRTFKLYRTLRKGRFITIGDGRNLRHPIYIDDIVNAFRLCLNNDDAVGEVILISGQRAITTNELIEDFCKIMEFPKPKIKIPYWAGHLMAQSIEKIFTLANKEPPISKRSLEFFDTNNAFKNDKATRLIGFEPQDSFDEGLRKYKHWLESTLLK